MKIMCSRSIVGIRLDLKGGSTGIQLVGRRGDILNNLLTKYKMIKMKKNL